MNKSKIIKGLLYSLKVYFIAHALPTLLFKYKQLKSEPKETLRKLLIRIGWSVCFFSGFIYLVRTTACILHRLIPFDRFFVILSASISSLPIVFEYTHRIIEYNLFTIPRVVEGFWDLGAKLGIINSLDSYNKVIFALFMSAALGLYKYYLEYVDDKYKLLLNFLFGR